MFSSRREIWYSLAAIVVLTALYLAFDQRFGSLPDASSLVGHGLGVLGIVLMLMTQTLYSIRKAIPDARWGSPAAWLKIHIFTGLVGPYMVLLHSSMKFRGLAGVSMLLTAVVVASGVVGRYIYTTAPHRILAEMSVLGVVARPPSARRGSLAVWRLVHVPLTWALFVTAFVHAFAALYYATLQR